MKFTLLRRYRDRDGVFGVLSIDDDKFCVTLEHAYLENGIYVSKIPDGLFTCVRGMHQLAGMVKPFSTFCINVPNHTGILFHPGNYNSDSEGCVLLGEKVVIANQVKMVTESRIAFTQFMDRVKTLDQFPLTVHTQYLI